jgi:hypothetical protein
MTAVADLRPSWSSRQVRPSAWLLRSFSWRKLTPRWRSILPQSVQLRCSSRFSFSGRDFGVPAVLSTHCSDAARWEVDSALFVAERRAKVLRLNALRPTNRLAPDGVGHREIELREDSRNLGDLRPRGSLWVGLRRQIARTRADFPQFSEMSDKRETGWWSRRDLNPRPLRCERSALPAELLPHCRNDIMTPNRLFMTLRSS